MTGVTGEIQTRIEHRAFHDFVRAALADHSTRVRLLRANRAHWLLGIAQRDIRAAERLWEGEGGSTR